MVSRESLSAGLEIEVLWRILTAMRWGFFAAGVSLVLGPSVAFGQLAFEKMLLEAKVNASEETLEVTFPFSNGSVETVMIDKIESSCGCLKASADVDEVAPGGKGVVTGVFSVGVRTGTFEKSLSVKTSMGGKVAQQDLRVRVEVPPLVELTPNIVSWEVGDALEPKEFVLKVLREKPIRVTEVRCSRAGFEGKIEEVEEGKEYRVVLTPASTADPLMGIVRIETDCEIEKHRRNLAYFSVKRASSSAGKR